jgi:hemolysin D
MSGRLQALLDISRRYGRVLRAAWSERRRLEPLDRAADELAFLPAHLELTDTPVSPVPRWSARLIMSFFAFALLWAWLGSLNIVAVAPGKTVALGRTKTIQPLETAVVRRILVHDGQHVKKGDLLLELDAEGVAADAGKAAEALTDARLVDLRTSALIRALDGGEPPHLENADAGARPGSGAIPGQALRATTASTAPNAGAGLPATTELLAMDGTPAGKLQSAQQQANSEFSAFMAQKQGLEATVAQKQAELHTTEAAIAPLQHYADISRERLAEYEKLIGKGYVSRQEYLARKQELINAERDAELQQHHRTELIAALAAAKEQLAATIADTRKQWLDQQRQARDQIQQSTLDLERAAQRGALMQLRAPVDGTVQQLAVHTVGGVVTPAQSLMAIVPSGVGFEVEAQVLDKDIGFVKQGQRVVVKLETFPYTRFGYLTGTIESVSHDAAQDDKLGLVFPARIRLDRDTLDIDGTQVRITAGMGVSAEIKTGQRRVIDYLLSPLETHVDEAMRER